MAWRSSGASNDDMIDNLKRYGVIHSVAVEAAFRAVDRRFFVPQNRPDLAHSDQPLREGSVHISAPHIYGCIVEALDITPASSNSFLNVGSGTGYISSVVAHIIGPTGQCYGVEISSDTLEHCVAAMDRFKSTVPSDVTKRLSSMEFIHGNGLEIDAKTGEALIGFDRIYVGASIEHQSLNQLASMLKVSGVLVAPVDDDLVKVTRIGLSSVGTVARAPRSIRGRTPPLSSDYSLQIISAVRFSPLSLSPSILTTIRSRVWEPALHGAYPESFRRSCKEILLCANAATIQPAPVVPVVVRKQINVAAHIPRTVWMEIMSYTHRDWFAKPHCEVEILRRRLEQEQLTLQRVQAAQVEVEHRLRRVENDRDKFRTMALRCQTRLDAILAGRDTGGLESPRDYYGATGNREFIDAMISGSAIMRHRHNETDDLDDSEEDDEEDILQDDDAIDDLNDSTVHGDDMTSESDDENSSHMEEASELAEADEFSMLIASSSSPVAAIPIIQGRQARTVSISNDGV